MDPILTTTARLAIALLFAHAALHKLREYSGFRATLASYGLLPARLVGPAAVLLVALESAVAAGAAFGRPIALVGAAMLLGLYGAAIATNLLRKRFVVDCGCGGPTQPISWWLAGRNAVLLGVALAALAPATARALGFLDYLGIVAGLLTLAALYAFANEAHAARAALEEWV